MNKLLHSTSISGINTMINVKQEQVPCDDQILNWEVATAQVYGNDESNRPKPSSGHSLTVIQSPRQGSCAYLFGGLVGFGKMENINYDEEDIDPAPTNSIFKLTLPSNDAPMVWSKVPIPPTSILPLSRWKHTATAFDETKILVFGGYHSSDHRLNDVWVFDTVSLSWSQPNAHHNHESSIKHQLTFSNWANVPPPRAGHSATLLKNMIYIFGGYGGLGYSRRDLDDLHALNIHTMQWTKIVVKGTTPDRRSGHQACAIDGNKIVICGGTSTSIQFQDVYVLDLTIEPTWSRLNSVLPTSLWNHCAISSVSVPYWKLFVFGGYVGGANEQNRSGMTSNAIHALDCGSFQWTIPNVIGTPPCSRCDSSMIYDRDNSNIIIYGGWSDYWHNDLYIIHAASVVGPPYAVLSMEPTEGPVTGGTTVAITGVDFVNATNILVQFSDSESKMVIEIPGIYDSNSSIICISPNFEKFTSSVVNIRLSLNGMPFTTHYLRYHIFPVTDARQCVAFGPGLLNGCIFEEPINFIIQARDGFGIDRTTGGDEFIVSIASATSENSSSPRIMNTTQGLDPKVKYITVNDLGDGRYWVTYEVSSYGRYKISISFAGTYGGVSGPLRGSEYEVNVIQSRLNQSPDTNKMMGELMIRSLKTNMSYLCSYVNEVSKNLFVKIKDDSWSVEEHIKVLMTVKETIIRTVNDADNIILLIDRNGCILKYFNENDLHLAGLDEDLNLAKTGWQKIQNESSQILSKVTAMMKGHTGKIKSDIVNYESHVRAYMEEMKKSDFYLFVTGPVCAMDNLDIAETAHQQQISICKKMSHVADIFDVSEDITDAKKIISEVSEILTNFRLLWETYVHVLVVIEEANSLPWASLDADAIEESSKSLTKSLRRLPKAVKSSDAFLGLDKIVKEFVVTCPIIISLRSPLMRERHWKELMHVVNRQFEIPTSNPSVKFKDLLKVRLHEHTAEIEEITEKANKEGKHEEILQTLESIWAQAMFSMNVYKDTDIPLLRLDDEVVEQLEADQMAVQSILGSRFVYFKSNALEWQQILAAISDVTILLSDIQRTWTYLEPLYMNSEEVKNELPEDTLKFQDVDKHVRMLLRKAWKMQIVKDFCMQRGLFEGLADLQKRQEICKKSLSDYLDGKRKKFPRFFFMSEADLLDILSNSSFPEKVLRHVDKIMLSTKEITIISKTVSSNTLCYATTFLSSVGEESFPFDQPIELSGKAEVYLNVLLLAQMRKLSICLGNSIKTYSSIPRVDWLLQKNEVNKAVDPAQISLLVGLIFFTRETEVGFMNESQGDQRRGLEYVFQLSKLQLADLISLTSKSLTKDDRQRVMCMITMDAHNRDIIDNLIREKVTVMTDFQWQSKLRASFNLNTPSSPSSIDAGLASSASFRICDACFEYGFEYLGNGPRLVVTPLTDRIYVTAAQALNLKMGCAPSGPAGTGKTETTKDFASSLGKCCYVFNCSPEMDYQTMGNIFKGLAASGSWGCFDEFNRLIPEVLSVCSVQFKAICDGLRNYSHDIDSSKYVTIEGDIVGLDPTVGVHITMNPGYLGRSELPEGLKALFRPITVMVPDLVLICENMLMAEGFQTAKVLATKFYALYSLLSELLSRQSHYDWGLRAVKSVLVVAGQFRRATPHLNEDDILFRALRDFNIPKIVQVDEVVFFGLLKDLFPELNPPRIVDDDLSECILSACSDMNLVPDPTFMLKVTQLEELLDIRHCVFIMGSPGSGKSSCWNTLKSARNIRTPNKKVKVVDINPKVLPTEDLYGHINLATREWKDGLLSCVMRDLGNIPNDSPKWIVLDGDLDANWIESMNSVMDDNKMLTLACNERIPLRSHMRMIFEIRDLKYATPATVSRAGILFLSTNDGSQWRCIVRRWILSRMKSSASNDDIIGSDTPTNSILQWQELFDKYLSDCLEFFSSTLRGVVYVNDISLTTWFLRLLDVMLPNSNVYDEIALETIFIFCLIWGVGSVLTISDDGTDHQKLFSDWFRAKFKTIKIPLRETVFDYWLDIKTMKFEPWKSCPTFKTIEFNSITMRMSEVTVPTAQTASLSYWMNYLVKQGDHVMLAGGSGTGKTQLINGLLSELNPEFNSSAIINLNYFTTAQVLQSNLEASLQKRTGSTYGPAGSVNLIYFIDDLNLPEVDMYGTQSAMALLRQHIDYGHWYDLHKLTIKKVDNCQYIAALNPTAGSFQVNPRLQRHFSTFAMSMPSITSLHTIYLTFVSGHLNSQNFRSSVTSVTANLIKGALAIHKDVSDTFRKTANNFHYEFHTRHISNVLQGLLNSSPEVVLDGEKFVFLWLHETERVYGDRLVDADDLAKFKQLLSNQAKKTFPQYNSSRFYLSGGGVHADPLVFCHFVPDMMNKGPSNDRDDVLVYNQGLTLNTLRNRLENILLEYNQMNPNMDLVLFDDAVLHVARIVRIINQPSGHALLIGVGGSGKQSLARLASYICGYYLFQLSSSSNYSLIDFKADLQILYNKAGVKNEGVLFLLTENQVNNERMFVYINDLLSSANIPELYNRDEKDSIISIITNKAKNDGYSTDPVAVWKYFISKVKQNLRICLCFSPVGNSLRVRARRFPAIISCTTIDWFQPWNEQALVSIGKKMLLTNGVLINSSSDISKAIEHYLPQAFAAVNKLSRIYFINEGRYVYTTPKSYLEMIQLFIFIYNKKTNETEGNLYRLQNGIEKLMKAAEDVVELEASLKLMLESAEEKKQIAESMASHVQQEKSIVELENEKVRIEEVKVETIQAEVSLKQADASKDLQQAEPALMRAMSALDSLDRRDLGNCRTMSKPPSGVEDVFAAVMVLLAGTNANIITQKNGKVREKERTWEAAKKALLGNVNTFMDELKGFKVLIDEGQVPEINWKEVRQFIALTHFNPEDIEKKNSAVAGLCAWVINIVNYYDIVQQVEPKRQALRLANAQLSNANEALASVRERLAELQEKIAVLTIEYNAAETQRYEAQVMADKGKMKLELARRLIISLGSEKIRWTNSVQKIKEEKMYLMGDCLLAATYISYMGPFSKDYREMYINNSLFPLLAKSTCNISYTKEKKGPFNPLKCVVTESQIAEYQTHGLPADTVSSENASIVMTSLRSPLMIDPQLQALNWIKSHLSPSIKLNIGRVGQEDLIERLIYAVEYGEVFLVENLGASIEPSLLPFICKKTIKRNSRVYLILANREIPISNKFHLFLHTKLSNPHYPPEIHAETTVVNFSVTQHGLEEQLLHMVVAYERHDLALQREALIMQQNLFTIKVKQLEDNILMQLADSSGDITENRGLIEELELSKKLSNEIIVKLEDSRITSEKLNITSEKYRPIARRGAMIFFVINSLYKIHSYYMFSLKSFVSFFFRGISSKNNSQANRNASASQSSHMRRISSTSSRINRSTVSSEAKIRVGSPQDAIKRINSESNLEYHPTETIRPSTGHSSTNIEMRLEQLGLEISQRVKEIEENDRLQQDLDMSEKITELMQNVSVKIHDYVKTGLFDEDKLIVAALITFKVLIDEGIIHKAYYDVLIHGRYAEDVPSRSDEIARWISESAWARLKALEEDLSHIDNKFENLIDKIILDCDDWEDWCSSSDVETRPMPGEFKEISSIQHLLLIRILRPDKLSIVLSKFIRIHFGEEFISNNVFHLENIYKYSTSKSPLLFILYPGIDPTGWIESLCDGYNIPNDLFLNISMGQGQERRANEAIVNLSKKGGWIFLQNVHLMQSWLPILEETLESLSPHPEFRVFMSTEPPVVKSIRNIPEGLLLSCITISNEPPSDLKSNLMRGWSLFDEESISSSLTPDIYKACLFGLCFFHSVMLGRRRFGCQGWSRPYSFNMGDLGICGDILASYLHSASQTALSETNLREISPNMIINVPWKDLRYLFGEIMYGGHITDFFDRRVNMTYLSVIFNDRLLRKGELAPKLFSPDSRILDYHNYKSFIETSLPSETPSMYGLHPNAEVGFLTNKSEHLFKSLLSLEIGTNISSVSPSNNTNNGSNNTSESVNPTNILPIQGKDDVLQDLLKRVPEPFDIHQIQIKAKGNIPGPDGPYIVVMIQECSRFNVVLDDIVSSLIELQKGLNGQLNMSQAMEDLLECLMLNIVPGRNPIHLCSWEKAAWASKKSLGSWFNDFLFRQKQLLEWSSSLQLPISVCLPSLINPMSLLTAIKQVTARKLRLPLDSMTIDTHVTRMVRVSEAIQSGLIPDDGILVHGLYIEGARWSDDDETSSTVTTVNSIPCCGYLCDSHPKQLLTSMPVMYIQAVQVKSDWKPEAVGYLRNDQSIYECPVYVTSARGNTYVFLSTLTTFSPTSKWILAGVALLMQSDD